MSGAAVSTLHVFLGSRVYSEAIRKEHRTSLIGQVIQSSRHSGSFVTLLPTVGRLVVPNSGWGAMLRDCLSRIVIAGISYDRLSLNISVTAYLLPSWPWWPLRTLDTVLSDICFHLCTFSCRKSFSASPGRLSLSTNMKIRRTTESGFVTCLFIITTVPNVRHCISTNCGIVSCPFIYY
jgi:hypothetical protein